MNQTVVNLENASIRQGDTVVLHELNLRIGHGEFVYLIGKTGSGKSSLLKTLYAALPLSNGKGVVAGFNLQTLNRKTIPLLRRELGIVFQDFNLLEDRNAEENLRFALRATGLSNQAEQDVRIREVLKQVDLEGRNLKMPHTLSGGEQQRLVIARALLNRPKLIIADEPTGNLDPETSDDILLLLRKLAREEQTAVLFATHDYRILEQFPARILRCMDARVFEDESFEL